MIWKALGGTAETKPADLTPPCEFPQALDYVWVWFGQMSCRRSNSAFGPNPIGWQDMAAWRDMTGNQPTPREVDLIMDLDTAFFSVKVK